MKSTYKLLGLVWDGTSDSCFESHCSVYLPLASTKESVSLMELLSANSADERTNVLSDFNNDKPIIVDFDCCYDSNNPVISAFLNKRICQVLSFLAEKYEEGKRQT